MKSTVLAAPIFAAALLCELGCGIFAPTAPETLPVSVQSRMAAPGEVVPAIHLSSVAGGITIRVTRESLCATLVTAAISRGPAMMSLVSHVSSDPLANCPAFQPSVVVDYTGIVKAVAPGTYQVRVFEGVGDGTPTLIGTGSVTVTR